ncbi:MAG: ribosome-associated translation inhibitor RaiA [Candidatus Gastranaerophilales bacterium]|nr:ribosome-associated translation inhibitor RaiA [Candidatus Gastranaerophilales bacterium]
MRITVKGRNIEITDAIRAYAEEKIGKVMNHYDQIQSIDVVLNVVKNPSVAQNHTAEVLCKFVSGSVKTEETAESMYASIDLVADKLSRQVQKFKEKNIGKAKSGSIRTDAAIEEEAEEIEEEQV